MFAVPAVPMKPTSNTCVDGCAANEYSIALSVFSTLPTLAANGSGPLGLTHTLQGVLSPQRVTSVPFPHCPSEVLMALVSFCFFPPHHSYVASFPSPATIAYSGYSLSLPSPYFTCSQPLLPLSSCLLKGTPTDGEPAEWLSTYSQLCLPLQWPLAAQSTQNRLAHTLLVRDRSSLINPNCK